MALPIRSKQVLSARVSSLSKNTKYLPLAKDRATLRDPPFHLLTLFLNTVISSNFLHHLLAISRLLSVDISSIKITS